MIGGNVQATLQVCVGYRMPSNGEQPPNWNNLAALTGWLDLQTGDSKYTYGAKLQESTHIFLCDYVDLYAQRDHFRKSNKRLVVNGVTYDVLLIDDPMELHQQLEIYLRMVG